MFVWSENLQYETSIPPGVPRLHQTEVAPWHDGIYEQGPRRQEQHTLSVGGMQISVLAVALYILDKQRKAHLT